MGKVNPPGVTLPPRRQRYPWGGNVAAPAVTLPMGGKRCRPGGGVTKLYIYRSWMKCFGFRENIILLAYEVWQSNGNNMFVYCLNDFPPFEIFKIFAISNYLSAEGYVPLHTLEHT